MSKEMAGFIYILTNSAMPGLVKIGMTLGDPEERARQLSQGTGTPVSFDVYAAFPVVDAVRAERQVHGAFDDVRTNRKREFFSIAPEEAVKLIETALQSQTDFGRLAREKQAKRILKACEIMEKNRQDTLKKRRDPGKMPYLKKLMAEADAKFGWDKKK